MNNVRCALIVVIMTNVLYGASNSDVYSNRIAAIDQLKECTKRVTGFVYLQQQGKLAADTYSARNNYNDPQLRREMHAELGKITNHTVLDALVERLAMQKFYAQLVELTGAFSSDTIKAKLLKPAFARLQYYIKEGNGAEIADLYFEAFYSNSYRALAEQELATITDDGVKQHVIFQLKARNEQYAAREVAALFYPVVTVARSTQPLVPHEESSQVGRVAALGAALALLGYAIRS